jgi:hypothetical protein
MTAYATIQEVNTSIMFSNFSNEQLNSINDAVSYARSQLRAVKIREFTRGDMVKFHSVKRGVTMTGTVSKVAIKYVTVATQQGLWKVPANMLEAA